MDINTHQCPSNIDNITIDTISDVENEIDPCDMVSLIFLLHEDPQLALNNLQVYLRVTRDIDQNHCKLLQDWASRTQNSSTWKSELLEALVTCQLNRVINKLGLTPTSVSNRLFRKGYTGIYFIHPIKKIFYTICESLDDKHFKRFKEVIKFNQSDILDHETCEVFFLELICKGYFSPMKTGSKINLDDVEKLINALEKTSGSEKTKDIQAVLNKLYEIRPEQIPIDKTPPKDSLEKKYVQDFYDSFELFNQLRVEDLKNDEINDGSE